jgi:signal transduction histidine kinase
MNFLRLKESSLARLLTIAIIVWTISAIIDMSMAHDNMIQNKSFIGLLISDIPEMFLFHRILYILIASFITTLILLYKAHCQLKNSENKLAELNNTLELKVIERNEELTNTNLKLENLNQSKSSILSLISHELKTPLNGIMCSAQLLLFELENTDNKEIAQALYESAKRLNNFSETALLVTKLTLREHDLLPIKINLEDFVNNISHLFDDLNSLNSLNITKNCFTENIYVEIDENLVAFSIKSILDNAIKFSDHGSVIKLTLSIEDDFFKLCFQDKGNGFTEEVLPQIFELFTVNDILHHSDGLGLSLAIVRLIMDYHNGKVDAKNIESGAEVSMFLPLTIE